MKEPSLKRRKAFHLGIEAEKLAGDHLSLLGFELLEHRYKTKYGEIDLIVRRKNLVVFVEVKARRSVDEGAYSVTLTAQKRIANSALLWMSENAETLGSDIDFRFDVAIMTPDKAITMIEAAFDASE
ncbi:MAG: YraN family protein [Hyphomicrobiales bacterium]